MSKKSRKLERKERQKKKQQELIQEQKEKFDIIAMLREQNLDTKPNFAKFLETYVKDIRMCIGGKVQFFPRLKYKPRKIFVTFLDGHELVHYVQVDYPTQCRYYLEDNLEDVELKPKEIELIQTFFDNLVRFNFVKLGGEDVE